MREDVASVSRLVAILIQKDARAVRGQNRDPSFRELFYAGRVDTKPVLLITTVQSDTPIRD